MDSINSVTRFLKAIADPTRLKLLKLLQSRPMCVCELTDALAVAQPTVSQHLRRLKAIGLVAERRDGQLVCYSLNGEAFAHQREALDSLLDSHAAAIPAMAVEWSRSTFGEPRVRCDRHDAALIQKEP